MQLMHLLPLVAILFAGGVALAIWSSLIASAMIEKVNRMLPEDQQVSHWWGYPGAFSEVRDHYKRFYPKGFLGRLLNLSMGIDRDHNGRGYLVSGARYGKSVNPLSAYATHGPHLVLSPKPRVRRRRGNIRGIALRTPS